MKFLLKLILFTFLAVIATAQTGGVYEITIASVNNGGGQSGGGNFDVNGSSGQPLAGTNSTGGGFGVRGGFWQEFFAPTAAMVPVSGKVVEAGGNGIFRAHVLLTNGNSVTRTAITNSFGYFRFDDVEVGQTYIISVRHKAYQFGNEIQVVFVGDEIADIIFNALPE